MTKRKPTYQRLPDDFEGDFDALKSWDTYLPEAKRLNLDLGIKRAGQHGMSCPTCYKQIQCIEGGANPRRKEWCQCRDKVRQSMHEIRAAHGFEEQEIHFCVGQPL